MEGVREVLASRFFTESQIKKVIPRLHEEHIKEPKYIGEIVDCWNDLMSNGLSEFKDPELSDRYTPQVAHPPKRSFISNCGFDMNTVLADIEPDLLLLDPTKLLTRHRRVQGLGICNTASDLWTILYNAPRGFYLQDWIELSKKIYYIEHYLIDFLYDKKEQKSLTTHPLVKSAASVEINFDQIRTRYLFAHRSGYHTLSHLYDVQMALEKPNLGDILLADNKSYLSKFTPFCSEEEYNSFSNLIKNYDFDEDDAKLFDNLAELDSLKH